MGDVSGAAAAVGTASDRQLESFRRLAFTAAPICVSIAALITIAVHRYLGLANADALLPSLMSTQHWTLFYWGQDRLANVVPLVAIPVRDPLWNFRVQSVVIASAFFTLIAIFVGFHLRETGRRVRPAAHAAITFVAGLVVMAPMRSIAGYRFVFEQLYCVSVLLILLGSVAWIRSQRYVLGAVLIQLALLINPSLLLAVPLLLLLDVEPIANRRRLAGLAAVVLAAFLVTGRAAARFATGPDVDEPYGEFRLGHLRSGIESAGRNIAHSMHAPLALGVAGAAVVIVAARSPRLGRRARLLYACVPCFSALWFLAFSTNGWVELNLYEFRYFYPLYITFMLFIAGATAEIGTRIPWATGAPASHRAPIWVATAAPVALLVPLLTTSGVDIGWIQSTKRDAVAAGEYEVDFVAGNYWHTWPVVVARRAEGDEVLGVTFRSDPLLDDIETRLADAVRDGRPIRVVCVLLDAVSCASEFTVRTGEPWIVSRTVSPDPLVIEIRPGAAT